RKLSGGLALGPTRLPPGLRIYTTLVAGALRVERRRFVVALVPATVMWVLFYVAIGAAVGIPAQRFFDRAAMLVVQAVILVVCIVGAFLAVRRVPHSSDSGLTRTPRPLRSALAIVIDLAVLTGVVIAVWEIVERLLPHGFGPPLLQQAVILLLSLALYVVAARRGPGATMGEALLQTTYTRARRVAEPAALP
ncbi:MAG: hypothetical protein ACR2MY_03760, partial [Candidatus Dormibacteria bacterium]